MKYSDDLTWACADYIYNNGVLFSVYIDLVVNRDYGIFNLSIRIKEDVAIRFGGVSDAFIYSILMASISQINFEEIAKDIFNEAQKYI